jgi:hypothetical protein
LITYHEQTNSLQHKALEQKMDCDLVQSQQQKISRGEIMGQPDISK